VIFDALFCLFIFAVTIVCCHFCLCMRFLEFVGLGLHESIWISAKDLYILPSPSQGHHAFDKKYKFLKVCYVMQRLEEL